MKDGNCRAKVAWMSLFVPVPGLHRLRSNDYRVQWTRINSHGRNSFVYQSSHLFNQLGMSGEFFESKDAFAASAKFRIFRDFENENC